MLSGTPTYIFDFDSTLIQVETLDELARLALADYRDRATILTALEALTAQGMAGELPFDKSLEKRLQLFQANRAHVRALIEQLAKQLSLSVVANIAWFQRNREHIFVISGGFVDYIVPLVEPLGILPDHVFANRFVYDAADQITGYDPANLLSKAGGKVAQVRALALPRPIIIIGDGYTDYEIRQAGEADEFWAFTENISRPKVVALADRVVADFNDFPYTEHI